MTSIDVVDSAVKIGLGAVITGIITWILARGNRDHEINKEHIRRRNDALEKISDQFGEVEKEYIHLFTHYNCLLDNPQNPLVAELHRREFLDSMKKMQDAMKTLYRIEGRLLLLGLAEAASAIAEFRVGFGGMLNGMRNEPPFPTTESIQLSSNQLGLVRNKIYSTLSASYRSIR